MQYNAPPGSLDPDAPYVNGTPGQVKGSPVNAHAVEYPQREILNVIAAAGFTPTNNELDQLLQAIKGLIASAIPVVPKEYDISMTLDYFLCTKIFKFIHPTPKSGMVPVNGTLITDAATRYPQAFSYLQSAEGQLLCTTESSWQAANIAVWASLADGTQVGWDGIGGVCKYVIDTNAGTIRVPDLRGMGDVAAGDGSLGVGGVQGDETRRVTARWINGWSSYYVPTVGTSGAVYTEIIAGNQAEPAGGIVTTQPYVVRFDNDRVEPTGDRVRTRAYGSLACVYLGIPS